MEIFCYKEISADSIDDLLKRISEKVSNAMSYNQEKIYLLMRERENLSPTAIGKGVLLPHIRIDDITSHFIFVFVLKEEIQYTTPDGLPVRFVFCIVSPSESKTEYLRLVASIVRMLKDDNLYKQISMADDTDKIRDIVASVLTQKGA